MGYGPWGRKELDTTERLHFHFRTSSPEDSISSNPERTALRRQEEESSYIEVCNKGQVVRTSKDYC